MNTTCEFEQCNKPISQGEYRYSLNRFGIALCIMHQKDKRIEEATMGKTPRKLAEFMNKNL